jgi:hypothetical protein
MKTYYCRKLKEDFRVDGNIHKAQWSSAEEVMLGSKTTGETPKQGTAVKLVWTDNFLYAAYHCEDNFIYATMTGYNDKIYEEEVVEIFIDDDRDLKTYIEIEVNPLNALLHYCIHNNLKGSIITFARTDKTIQTAVCRDDAKGIWNVEIAIPFSEFYTAPNMPPKPGDKWLMNLYRIDKLQGGGGENTTWSPIGDSHSFHTPRSFGELIFEE